MTKTFALEHMRRHDLLDGMSKGDILDGLRVSGPEYIAHPFRRAVELGIIAAVSPLAIPIGTIAAIGSQVETGNWRYEPTRQDHKLKKIRTIPEGKERAGLTGVNIPEAEKWGAILREKGIDELPHLWLVLRGRGSIISPRPLNDEAKEARRGASRVLADEFIERASLEATHVNLLPGLVDPPSIWGHENPGDYSDTMLRQQMLLGLRWIDTVSARNDLQTFRQAARVVRGKPSGIIPIDEAEYFKKVA